MFSLAINFGASGNAWSFLFTKKESADSVIAQLQHPTANKLVAATPIQITDDFGTTAEIHADLVNGWIMENMELTKGANIARSMWQARTQAEFQAMAQSDRTLDILRPGGGQSPIISPFPRQGRAS